MYNQLRREAAEAGDVAAARNPATLTHQYLKSSPELTELFTIVSTAEKNYALLWRLADIFALLISQSQHSAFQSLGAAACQKFIRFFMRQIYVLCLAADDRIKHAALRLMLAIAQFSNATGRDFYLRLNTSFDAFLKMPFRVKAIANSGGGGGVDRVKLARAQETRELYMELILTFLRIGETDVVFAEKVLRVKGLVSSIFGGLASDPPAVVAAFLTALKTSVLQHKLLAARYDSTAVETFNSFFFLCVLFAFHVFVLLSVSVT